MIPFLKHGEVGSSRFASILKPIITQIISSYERNDHFFLAGALRDEPKIKQRLQLEKVRLTF